MNGCLLFSLLIYGFFRTVKYRSQGSVRQDFWKDALRSLRERDYLLRGLSPSSSAETVLSEVLKAEIRAGRLRLEDLEVIGSYYEESSRLSLESAQLLWSYVTHIGFVLLVPLLFRMGLSRKLQFDGSDFGEVFLATLVACLGMFVLSKEWPQTVLHEGEKLRDFVRAYLGADGAGLFEADLKRLRDKAWHEGIDDRTERREFLEAWHLGQIAIFKNRLSWFENALGPLELAASCLFSCILLGLPLLSHFSGLIRG